ncbi:hypothetical protein COPEUT_01642 [Coprococcus eutactus ATCC 27759]|nr:hypothetical protein COPEUT_01642 [Coprococcus eutactus ATCC 27759]
MNFFMVYILLVFRFCYYCSRWKQDYAVNINMFIKKE